MDDIQFWIYVLFGLIYVITRALRKKQPQDTELPTEDAPETAQPRRQPKSFEELLREFTEAGTQKPEEAPRPVEERSPKPTPAPEYRRTPEKQRRQKAIEEEGRTRHFADDESRKIYEESIKQAQATPVTYERDEHFKIVKDDDSKGPGRSSAVAREVKEILSSPDSARKAVILAEIFNRKY